mmetsp:Transcript_20274/g.25068  ORF Transcript_20274/g.25068 Transcript_20274/m.25068 type:complete len:123 (+) Transcript_20274:291-659(+)
MDMKIPMIAGVAFYIALFLGTLTTILYTLINHPLFPLRTDDLAWSNAWLAATVVDYYGACLCLCGVVISSEESRILGVAWVTGMCVLGSPVCCLWVLLRLVGKHGGGSLRIEGRCHQEHMSE